MADRWLLQYDSTNGNFAVIHSCGKVAQTIGSYLNNEMFLSFSEGLYLIQQGRANLIGAPDELFHAACQRAERLSFLTYSKLKTLGFILRESAQDQAEFQIYKPDSQFRRSCPPPPFATLVHSLAEDPIPSPFGNLKIFSVYDGFSQVLLKCRWVELDPSEPETID